jgi:cytochrome c-type biogenesis protein
MTFDLGSTLNDNPLLAIALVYGGGVLTSLTPCLYPMIPVTVAVVGGGAVRPTRSRRMLLGITYVAGLAAAYASLGLVAGMTGTMFGTISTNPWLYFAMANAMLAAALMMLDALPLPIPAALLTKASTMGTGGRFGGVLLMGIVSGLVAAPCGAPMFAAVLTWVTATGSPVLGFVYLMAFSVGMCSLLLAIVFAADSSLRLPRPGPWMLWVKRGLGLLLIGVAEYYLISMGQLII